MKLLLKEQLKEAMKAKDRVKMDTLRAALSAIQYEEMQKGTEDLPEETFHAILKNEIKKRREAIEYAEKANRLEEIETAKIEIYVLEGFLPTQLSAEQLEKELLGLKESTPGINMGQAMKALKDKFSGQYDGKLASDLAKKVFS